MKYIYNLIVVEYQYPRFKGDFGNWKVEFNENEKFKIDLYFNEHYVEKKNLKIKKIQKKTEKELKILYIMFFFNK